MFTYKNVLLWIAAILFGVLVLFILVKQTGACPTPTPTCIKPTPTLTPAPTLVLTPTGEPGKPTPTPSPVAQEPALVPTLVPTATLTLIPTPGPSGGTGEPASPPVCFAEPLRQAPVVLKAMRDGKGNLSIGWTPVENHGYIILYTPTGKADWLWSALNVQSSPYQIHGVWEMVDVSVCALSVCGQELCSTRFVDP